MTWNLPRAPLAAPALLRPSAAETRLDQVTHVREGATIDVQGVGQAAPTPPNQHEIDSGDLDDGRDIGAVLIGQGLAARWSA